MSYQVYRILYTSLPRNHHGVFVECNTDQSGQLFHVTGSIHDGMRYEVKQARKPEESRQFHSKERIGSVLIADFKHINAILKNIAPPKKQYHRGNRLNPHEPLRRCQEWTTEAIKALKSSGVVKD